MSEIMNDNKKFLELLEKGNDEELAKIFRTTSSHTEMGGIPSEIRREMIKGELDYRNATKMIVLTRRLFWLTIILCLLTFALIGLTLKLIFP